MTETEKKMDEKIMACIRQQKIQLPKSYEERVESLISEWEQKEMPMHNGYRLPRAAVAVLAVCLLILGGTAAYAAVDYVRQRIEQVSPQEREQYTEDLQNSEASADSFSRPLTEEEKAQMRRLAEEYQSSGLYPKETLRQIDDVSEVDPEHVCFLPETSTFYLPDRTLTEEEMLEIIDFYFIRDYSVVENGGIREDVEVENNITEERAVKIAADTVETLFGVKTDTMDVEYAYEQGDYGVSGFSTEYVSFRKGTAVYRVAVDMQSGRVGSVEQQEKADIYTEGISADKALWKEHYSEAERKAGIFLGVDPTWKSAEVAYLADENGILRNGVVNYYFVDEGGDACAVSYSCEADVIYQIRYFTEEGLAAKKESDRRLAEGGGWIFRDEAM